ncbi:DUF6518 family protein [Kineosporia mesophila]|uniref:DUF6518 family protein n=1 Tax=Kineosporia mesophila TaxID=566012 RepID=UPI001E43EFF4|nr:DUF6518 family protein [Kineosporia mesophila]
MSRTTSHHVTDSLRAGLMVGVLSFVIGALTAWAQTVLPYSLYSLANSANAWVLVIVVLILGVRAGPALATLLGSASSVLLMLGFTAGLALYGKPYDPLLWTLSSAVAGLFIGLSAAWLRGDGVRPALATAALAGVTIGEALFGLTYVRETTSPVYWILSGIAGITFLAAMLARRIRGPLPTAVALAGAVAVIVVFIPVYGTVGTYA